MSHRVARAEKEIREVIGQFLITRYQSELRGLVTVSRVVVSSDIRTARVFITHYGDPKDVKPNVELLNDEAYEFQRELTRRLPMKFCPKIKFFFDEAYYSAMAIDQALHKMRTGETSSAEDTPSEDSLDQPSTSADHDE